MRGARAGPHCGSGAVRWALARSTPDAWVTLARTVERWAGPERSRTIGSSHPGTPDPADERIAMSATAAPRRSTRWLALLAVALLLPAILPAATANAADISVSDAQGRLIRGLNAERAAVGLVALQPDARLMAIAQARSADMVANAYYGHTAPDGRTVFSLLAARRVAFSSAGETLAKDHYPTLPYSVGITRYQWMHSAPHRALVLSAAMNYVGVGLAIAADGTHVWTAVFTRSPDHTGGWVKPRTPSVGSVHSGRRTVTIAWRAGDTRLQVLTRGLRDVQVQRRTDGGAWVGLGWTTASRITQTLRVGHRYEFRFRARDRGGNVGAWSARVVVRP
jgi:uncharacterized protein YkwD